MSDRRPLFSHTTVFLRNRPQLEELAGVLLPRIWPDGGSVEALVCGGSTGCEALSLLVALREFQPPGRRARLDTRVLSLDLDEAVTAAAREARYAPENFSPLFGIEGGMPDEMRARWFQAETPTTAGETIIWRARPELAERVVAQTLDLRTARLAHEFDIIVCQNVLTHYEPAAARDLLSRLLALARQRAVFVCSGVDLNLKGHLAAAGFQPWTGRIAEIHDAFASHRMHYRENRGLHYFELEDIDRARPDWATRYSTLFYRE